MRHALLVPIVVFFPALAQGQNLLVNPRFDTDLSGWTAIGMYASWSSLDADGAGNSGSGWVSASTSPYGPCSTQAMISQCIPVDGWGYELSGAFRWSGLGGAELTLGFYEGTECNTDTVWSAGVLGGLGPSPPRDTWTPFKLTVVRPIAARSASVWVHAFTCPLGPGPVSMDAWMDNLSVSPAHPPPPMLFHTVTPCRLFDTREADGPALAGERKVTAGGKCEIPSSARALSVNVTVTGGTEAGDLRLRAPNVPPSDTSTINYGPGQTRANSATVGIDNGELLIQVDQETGFVQVILDVNGYFE